MGRGESCGGEEKICVQPYDVRFGPVVMHSQAFLSNGNFRLHVCWDLPGLDLVGNYLLRFSLNLRFDNEIADFS
jgi:hypothetical protein